MKRSLLFFALLFCLSSPALAQDEKAQKLFQEAELYFKAAKYDKAADLYTEAFVASQINDLLFNVAQCYRNLKNYEDTFKTFRQYMLLVSASDEELAESLLGLKRIQALLLDIEAENGFPKKNPAIKKLLQENKELVNTLLNRAATLPKPSALSITGTQEATVFLDDLKLEGKTPLDILKAKKGSHKLSVTKEGYFPWSKTFDVAGDGKPLSFLVELAPIVLVIEGTPGADVLLNGELKGKVPFRAEAIKAGAYKVSVRLSGHKDWYSDVILPGSDQRPVSLSAELPPYVLKVNGPAEAELSLDGDFQGKLPASIEKIPVGKHKLTVKQAGFEDWSGEIIVNNDKILYEQDITLKPQRAKEAPTTQESKTKSAAPYALYSASAVSAGLGVVALAGSLKARNDAIEVLDANQSSLLDLALILEKQSKQLGAASVAAFVVAASAGVGGVVLSTKSKATDAVQLSLTPAGVSLSGRF